MSTTHQTRWLQCGVKIETDLYSKNYDGIILVSGKPPGCDEPEPFKTVLYAASQIDAALGEEGAVLPISVPAKRLIYSPAASASLYSLDYYDVRSFAKAARDGMKRALKAGVRCPLLVLLPDERFPMVELVTLLGALEHLYVNIQLREADPERCYKVHQLGVWSTICSEKLEACVNLAISLESGRYVARDIGTADPERMTPIRVEEYVRELFENTNVKVEVICDEETLLKEYPLFAAVNRAASVIPRHAGRIIYLTYEPPNVADITETIFLVGKGVTYDTGGADVKINGTMPGMSRDKCGAAACAGFMQVTNLLQPRTVKVVTALCVVRNSIGENCYVADEVITAKSGRRVRVLNTDAEGRFAMADALYHMKEMALCSTNPHIYTIATLTGFAETLAGPGYTVAMDNSVALSARSAQELQQCGELSGDPLELVQIRREDFEFHKGKMEGDDVVQSGAKGASMRRGCQRPGAFLIMASGLDNHGLGHCRPLKYTHIDMGQGRYEDAYRGNPIIVLAYRYILRDSDQQKHQAPVNQTPECQPAPCQPVPCQPEPCPEPIPVIPVQIVSEEPCLQRTKSAISCNAPAKICSRPATPCRANDKPKIERRCGL